jgi:hypothetical protein
MKKLKSLSLCGILFFLVMGAGLVKPRLTAPPGTVRLADNLYIDAGPVRNVDYLEFLNFSKSYNWERFFNEKTNLPAYGLTWDSLSILFHDYPSDKNFLSRFVPADSVIEISSNDLVHPKAANPFRHKDYNNYPIVNITYGQALKFCEWRTHMVACYLSISCKTAEERKKKYFSRLTYRLPTKEEWEKALKELGGKIKAGKREFKEGLPLTLASPGTEKFSYQAYSVAEMLAEKGKCEGLSYKDISLTDIYTLQNYEGPHPWVGFRCVCEVGE